MALAAYTKTCESNNGGGSKLYFIAKDDVTSFTLKTGSQYYDTMTLGSGKLFYEYDFEEYTAQLTPVMEGVQGATKWTHTLMFNMSALSDEQRTGLVNLIEENPCGLIGIFVDNNDRKWVLGYDEKDDGDHPLKVTSGAGDSKMDLLEPSEMVVTMVCINREQCREFVGTVTIT